MLSKTVKRVPAKLRQVLHRKVKKMKKMQAALLMALMVLAMTITTSTTASAQSGLHADTEVCLTSDNYCAVPPPPSAPLCDPLSLSGCVLQPPPSMYEVVVGSFASVLGLLP